MKFFLLALSFMIGASSAFAESEFERGFAAGQRSCEQASPPLMSGRYECAWADSSGRFSDYRKGFVGLSVTPRGRGFSAQFSFISGSAEHAFFGRYETRQNDPFTFNGGTNNFYDLKVVTPSRFEVRDRDSIYIKATCDLK